MRILIISGSLPYPPASGGALRVSGILQGLQAAGHQLTLMTFHSNELERTPLAQWCEQIITVPYPVRSRWQRLRDLIFTRQPDIARRLYTEAFAERLRFLLAKETFDLIQFEGIEVAPYLPIAKATQPKAKLCFDTFNAEYLLQRVIAQIDRQTIRRWPAALYSTIQATRIEQFEREMSQLADLVIAVSPEDADALRGFRVDQQIFIVPSGITVDAYSKRQKSIELGKQAIVFTGKMDYRPNVDAMLWFGESIFPKIQAALPDAKLYIVGQQPHARLNGLQAKIGIFLTGWVDSVQPYLQNASVYVAPLRMGSGTRLKLLEAMASGCAIVATPAAAAGLSVEVNTVMRIAADEDSIANEVIDLIRHPDQQTALGQRARDYVRAHYDWSVLIPRLLLAYKEIGLG
ncbi:MAG: glycosyltransferase [Anaerolineae bacterium]|jgi:glycosyltransferase involved in cell wall biosynthesis|nr:glycosyltransferase [Anaerolineae bacterium]